jgi:class 3 adenylate cyclase
VTDAPRIATPAYRGFLFSDIRGFTAFGERYGNAAAAAAVGRFLEIARTAIARHEGAEIKTEGDAIHAVFPSASSAVLCGLDIVDAAAERNAQEAGPPVGIGVGVHAGEAVETAEGYIGRAVNIAARLCAVARPGEVLVSSTVKGIAQASIPVGFIPRGRRRLKGINDPILVYAVTRDANARAPRWMRRPALVAAAGVAALVVIASVAVLGSQVLRGSGAAASTGVARSDGPTSRPIAIGALSLGSYASTSFVPAVRFNIGDLGWAASRDSPAMLALEREASPKGSVFFLRVKSVIESPCLAGGEGADAPPRSVDLLTTLESRPYLKFADRQRVQLGDYAGQQVDITVDEGALAACGGLVDAGVPLFEAGSDVWSATPGEQFRLIAVDVGDRPVTVIVSTDWTAPPAVQEIERVLELGQRILDTVHF